MRCFLVQQPYCNACNCGIQGAKYYLPPRSISILPDCRTVVYNTRMIVLQHNARNYKKSKIAHNLQWTMVKETIPTRDVSPLKSLEPLEHFGTTKDTTDYLWFMTSGSFLEHRVAGVRTASLHGLNTCTLDLSYNGWWHKVGLDGEKLNIFTEQGSHRFQWTKVNNGPGPALRRYKAYFDAPEGNNPVTIQMETMSKGMIWVNEKSIGRCWASYLSPPGKPSQPVYHIRRAFLQPKENLLVVLEETGGKLDGVEILTVNTDTICSIIREDHPPNVETWRRENSVVSTNVDSPKSTANLMCPDNKTINRVDLASYGDPLGACGHFSLGKCTSLNSQKVVEQYCLGKTKCSVPWTRIFLVSMEILAQEA